jgi:tripartite-type tricarboxylate transporter receptor subunit TctC
MSHPRALVLVTAALACGSPVAAQEAHDFYKGKTLTIIASDGPGGASDAYARLVAQNLVRFLPGNPSAVVQAMPGASGLLATNHIHRQAAHDGTVVAMPLATAMFAPIFGDAGAHYKSDGFAWIGSLDQATDTCSYWKGNGVADFRDLFHKNVTFAADAPAGVGSQFPRAMNALLGTRADVIHGYMGTGNVVVAMKRGEIQTSCNFMVSALTSVFKTYFDSGELVPFVQFARKNELLPNVPYIMDYAKTEDDKNVFKLVFMRDTVSRAIVAPPDIPQERKDELRSAFDQTVKDPDFLAQARKMGLPIHPMSGAADDAFVHDLMSIPAADVARANAALQSGLGDHRNAPSENAAAH